MSKTGSPSSNRKIVVDTNVLLTDPKFFESIRDAEVVIPQVVLSELDKVKAGRGDNDAKFRGREVSRFLFELSERGELTSGVSLGKGATLRIDPFEIAGDLPPALKGKTADDIILATALELMKDERNDVILLTNDLNMLIKAQALSIPVTRAHKEERRRLGSVLARRWQTTVFPALVVILLAMLALFMYKLIDWIQQGPTAQPGVSSTGDDADAIRRLQQSLTGGPGDFEELVTLGNIYQQRREWDQAAQYYQRAVLLNSRDTNVRVNMAISFFNSGRQTAAVQVLNQVISEDYSNGPAHFNLGAMYYTLARASAEGERPDEASELRKRAATELNIYLRLAPEGDSASAAKNMLSDITRTSEG